jgi:hypothetical protein
MGYGRRSSSANRSVSRSSGSRRYNGGSSARRSSSGGSGGKSTNSGGSLQIRTNSSGYRQYKSPTSGGWKLTHRTVAAKKMGSPIRSGHEVHHIDGNKTNNRPSNLTVISKALHRVIHRRK